MILQQNADFSNDRFNNRVESAVISGSCTWILYDGVHFNRATYSTGRSHNVRQGRHNTAISWGGPGNRISSARALPPDGTIAIALFEHADFEGRMTVLYRSTNNFRALDFDDQVGSVIVTEGFWTLYQYSNYRGKSTWLRYGHYRDISGFRIGGNQLSSVQLYSPSQSG